MGPCKNVITNQIILQNDFRLLVKCWGPSLVEGCFLSTLRALCLLFDPTNNKETKIVLLGSIHSDFSLKQYLYCLSIHFTHLIPQQFSWKNCIHEEKHPCKSVLCNDYGYAYGHVYMRIYPHICDLHICTKTIDNQAQEFMYTYLVCGC